MKQIVFTFAFFWVLSVGLAQSGSVATIDQGKLLRGFVEDGDTVAVMNLRTYRVVGKRVWKSKRAEKRHWRLVRNVKKVYPYAKLAGDKLEEYAEELAAIEKQKDRKKFLKRVEKELKAEYEGDLRKLTVTQGRILIKLIDRETGNTSFALVKDLRGAFSAFFWQSLARLFGHNLKSNYDPYGEDKEIEQIVLAIEAGEL